MSDETLYCPLHGEYVSTDDSGRCPACEDDPVASSASLRQVRVIGEDELAPGAAMGADLTPMVDDFPCPVCGTSTPAGRFRVESIGEVWTGNAAVWAEEGVCYDCYREVLKPQIREWSATEWLVHHYEGWRATVDTVHNIFVYEESVQEGWLPDEDRHKVIDVERTLSARREHLARCQMTMRDLQGRYSSNLTPPPFQMTLASGGEAVSPRAIAELKGMRERDLDLEMKRRDESILIRAPSSPDDDWTSEPGSEVPTEPVEVRRVDSRVPWLLLAVSLALIAGLVVALIFLLSRS